MQYITKKQHRTRYAGFPIDCPNVYSQKHHLEFNGLGEEFDFSSMTPDEFTAKVDSLDPTQFDAMQFDFTWDLNLTGTVLDIKFINATEENRVISHLSVDMAHLNDAAACTVWYPNDEVMSKSVRKDILLEDAPLTTVQKSQLVSPSLENSVNFRKILGVNTILAFVVTKDNPTPNDIIVVIFRPVTSADPDYDDITPEMALDNIENNPNEGDNTVTVTGNLTKHPLDPVQSFPRDLIPEITVTSSTVSGDVVTVNFTTESNINEIYLVQDYGYLPKTRVPVTNGSGTFKVVTTGMDPGDEVIVKMGYKFFVNRNTFTKTL